MDAHIATATDPGADPGLLLAQWLSPAFPTGGFTFSHGLETAVAEGVVRDADTFLAWLTGIVQHGAGYTDLVLLALSQRSADPSEIDALARALSPSAERHEETVAQGSAFVACVNPVWGLALPDLALPVALGQAARAASLPLEPTLRHYLQAFISNLAHAAIRLVPLGQTDGQRAIQHVMHRAGPVIAAALAAGPEDIGGLAFAGDIGSMRHETLSPRLFRS